ncbi:hypothetical protein NC653_039429 [Populus alba x Populus x berolinensis]|uniref:Transposase n=1 Tax=Populus alba x Populus x berolinensis TaxID=444605 RepID=A0AAD6LB87_9ROSI|nr:hypothetical protein NC653_039429 [Populus alba x Populus x berolinensis]
MSFSNDMDGEYEKLFRRLNPPRVVIDNEACKNATVIRVHGANKHGTLLCGILIHDGCTNHNKLSVVAQVFTIKLDHGLSEVGYDKIIEWVTRILPEGSRLKENFYAAKSMMKPLGLGYQKINMCPNFYMLYYLENVKLIECMTCGYSRYKPRIDRGKTLVAYKKLRYFPITPRLQRLFMSLRTAKHMRWHQSHHMVDGVMVHPSDGEACKHFDSIYPHFLAESRNMYLGLCIDRFNPFGSFASPYSCWSVILTIYNLPPGMCMGLEFIFLSMVIPGLSSPGRNIDVCLRSLIDELIVEKNVAPPHLFSEELYDVVSEYSDIVFGLQSGKQKFSGFGLTHN